MRRTEILAVLLFVSLCLLLPRMHAQDTHEEVMGKALRCEKDGDYAQQVYDKIRDDENPTVTFKDQHSYDVFLLLRACVHEQKPVRQCVISKCVGGRET